jgi:hypothetical protein
LQQAADSELAPGTEAAVIGEGELGGGVPRRRFALSGLAVSAAAATVLLTILVSARAASVEPPRSPVLKTSEGLIEIRHPHDEFFQRGKRFKVELALKHGVSLRHARLNGRETKKFFHVKRRATADKPGLVVATLLKRTLGKDLKRGRNFLRFTVRRGGKRGTFDFETLSFTRVRPRSSLVKRFGVYHKPSKPPRVRLVVSRFQTKITARLNGHDIADQFQFDYGDGRRRVVHLGASDGLKHGANHLWIRVTHHGGVTRTLKRDFEIPRRRTIAGAGPDQTVPFGQSFELDGSSSRHSRPTSGDLRFRWTIARKPRGSHPEIEGQNKRRPTLRTDMPGRYKIKLRTTEAPSTGATASYDVADVDVQSQPYAYYNAFATVDGKTGIRVDPTRDCPGTTATNCFYENPGDADDLQVVILERSGLTGKTRSTLTNETFSANNSFETNDLSAFAALMKKLVSDSDPACPEFDDDTLVLLALRGGKIEDEANWAAAMQWVRNAPNGECASPDEDLDAPQNAFAAIGIPGMLPGQLWINDGHTLASDESKQAGNLVGYFSQTSGAPADQPPCVGENSCSGASNNDSQDWPSSILTTANTFSYTDAVPFNTRDTSGGAASFSIGADSVAVPSDKGPGIAVFSFDPINPEGSVKLAKYVGQVSDGNGLDWTALDTELESLIDVDIDAGESEVGIALVSNGQIGGYTNEPASKDFPGVVEKIAALGGNPDTFARTVNGSTSQDQIAYSLISPFTAAENTKDRGGAAESSGLMAQGVSGLPVNNGTVTGTLERISNGYMTIKMSDPSGQDLQPGVEQLLKQPQIDWLLTPDPGAKGATCQELALAFVVTAAFDGSPFAGDYGELWSGSDDSACAPVAHPNTNVGDNTSADSLANKNCVFDSSDPTSQGADEPNAIGANAANVREASMWMRDQYQKTDFDGDANAIDDVTMPTDPGAPFESADLECAKLHLKSEFTAWNQTRTFLDSIYQTYQGTQAAQTEAMNQASTNAQQAALSPDLSKLAQTPSDSTTAFWADFGLGLFEDIAGSIALYEPAGLVAGGLAQAGYLTSTIFDTAQGPPSGDPAERADQYLLLQSSLDSEEVSTEYQMTLTGLAEANGINVTARSLLYADPAKLATVNKNASTWGSYLSDTGAIEGAQLQKVTQMTYQQLWPQIYYAVRVNWLRGCWGIAGQGGLGCAAVHKGAFDGFDGAAGSIDDAGDIQRCENGNVSTKPVWPGTVVDSAGLGAGNEYHPQVALAAAGDGLQYYDVYLMLENNDDLVDADKRHPDIASESQIAPFFNLPSTDTKTGDVTPANTNAGFFPPDFWQDTLQFGLRIHCTDANNSSGEKFETSTVPGVDFGVEDGEYFVQSMTAAFDSQLLLADDIVPTDLWPTLSCDAPPCPYPPPGTRKSRRGKGPGKAATAPPARDPASPGAAPSAGSGGRPYL